MVTSFFFLLLPLSIGLLILIYISEVKPFLGPIAGEFRLFIARNDVLLGLVQILSRGDLSILKVDIPVPLSELMLGRIESRFAF